MDFRRKVLAFIKSIPRAKVVSYGQVAAAAGSPRAAQAVGGILRATDNEKQQIPWWRVINNAGVISIKGNWTATKELQAVLLKKEGVVIDKNYTVDMKKYRL